MRQEAGVNAGGIKMSDYLTLWVDFLKGIVSLIAAIILPIAWLAIMILPYGASCLFTGMRLRKGYRYFYFLPRFIKEITKPLRGRQ